MIFEIAKYIKMMIILFIYKWPILCLIHKIDTKEEVKLNNIKNQCINNSGAIYLDNKDITNHNFNIDLTHDLA